MCSTGMKECVWYNGEEGVYELLDFDPNCRDTKEIREMAWYRLSEKYSFDVTHKNSILSTLYLLPVDCLIHVGGNYVRLDRIEQEG